MTIPSPHTPAYWLQAFSNADSLDALQAVFGAWWTGFREGMTPAQRQEVERAKDARKRQFRRVA